MEGRENGGRIPYRHINLLGENYVIMGKKEKKKGCDIRMTSLGK